MKNSWDINAQLRHEQILSGKDISFSKVLVPNLIHLLKKLNHHNDFHLLDLGCGTGVLAKELSKYVKRVHGLDPSIESISIAKEFTKEINSISLECSTIEEHINNVTQKYDAVISNMTLHTIKNLEQTLNAIAKSLKSKGSFIFSIPHPTFYPLLVKPIQKSGYTYHIQSNYSIPFIISKDKNPLPSYISYFHRPFEIYSKSLETTGFMICKIREPIPDQKTMQEYRKPWEFPRFLLMHCLKL